MKVLVINAGSSSLKYQLIDMATDEAIAKGLCERIGMDGKITHKTSTGVEISYEVAFPTHKEAFEELTKVLTSGEGKVIDSLDEVSAIGHRAVHGGEKFSSSVIIDDEMMQTMDDLADLAPLHNPPGLTGMKACKEVLAKMFPWLVYLIPLSIRPCPPRLTFTPFLTNTTKSTASAATASTVPAIVLFPTVWPKLPARRI